MLPSLGRAALASLALFAVGCSGNESPAPGTPSGPNGTPSDPNGYCGDQTPGLIAAAGDPTDPVAPLTEEPVASSTCNAVERSYPLGSRNHVTTCSLIEYDTNPPSSGDHYPFFPQFRVYQYAIPRGFWVHSMEHGGVVFTYSCTDCGDEVKQAEALIAKTAIDPLCCSASGCSSTDTNQLLMTPDPGIPTRWAATSWGFTLTADCFESDVFANFIASHRNTSQAPELICDNLYATDVTKPPTN